CTSVVVVSALKEYGLNSW
nr:immunoglobulin heavy chain junction region [Macaca mulatta]